jgi:hypothetical protein
MNTHRVLAIGALLLLLVASGWAAKKEQPLSPTSKANVAEKTKATTQKQTAKGDIEVPRSTTEATEPNPSTQAGRRHRARTTVSTHRPASRQSVSPRAPITRPVSVTGMAPGAEGAVARTRAITTRTAS